VLLLDLLAVELRRYAEHQLLTRGRSVAGLVSALVIGTACNNVRHTTQAVAGCYVLERKAWQAFGPMLDDTLVHDPPSLIRLLVAPADTTFARNRHRVIARGFRLAWLSDSVAPRYVTLATENYLRFSSWALEPGDTLDIAWMNGLTGVHLRLTPQRGGWRGTARTISDQRPSPTAFARAEVTARRISCTGETSVDSLPPPA
jgi:hypothetical protein